eukprot:Nk52_evm8s239 gene=Nk52_evmTU8s239
MFWRFGFHQTSAIDSILENGDFTLEDLLDESDIVQETKSGNKGLVEYLSKDESLEKLLDYIVQEPPDTIEEKQKYKYPNICAEILSCEVYPIYSRICFNKDKLGKLWAFFTNPAPLNPLLTSFCSKVFVMLLNKRPTETVDFLKEQEGCLNVLMNHLSTSAAADFLLKFLSCYDLEECEGLLGWFREEKVISRLVDMFGKDHDEDVQDSAAQLLIDLFILDKTEIDENKISSALDKFENEKQDEKHKSKFLSDDLVEKDVLMRLLDYMFEGESYTLMSGALVFLALLTPYTSQQTDLVIEEISKKRDAATHKIALDALILYVPKMKSLLTEPVACRPIVLSSGTLDPPLGMVRLRIIELLDYIVKINYLPMCAALASESILKICLELMLKYEWNNFLHCEVADMLRTVVSQEPPSDLRYVSIAESEKKTDNADEGAEKEARHPLLVNMFEECGILKAICTSAEENAISSCDVSRKGYMGHLFSVANVIIEVFEENFHQKWSYFKDISPGFDDEWKKFTKDVLPEVNEFYHSQLGGHKPLKLGNEDEGSSDDKMGNISGSGADDQLEFNRYLCQQITNELPDDFGRDQDDEDEENGKRMPRADLPEGNFVGGVDWTNKAAFEEILKERHMMYGFEDSSDEEDGEKFENQFHSGDINEIMGIDELKLQDKAPSVEDAGDPWSVGDAHDSGEGWAADWGDSSESKKEETVEENWANFS